MNRFVCMLTMLLVIVPVCSTEAGECNLRMQLFEISGAVTSDGGPVFQKLYSCDGVNWFKEEPVVKGVQSDTQNDTLQELEEFRQQQAYRYRHYNNDRYYTNGGQRELLRGSVHVEMQVVSRRYYYPRHHRRHYREW